MLKKFDNMSARRRAAYDGHPQNVTQGRCGGPTQSCPGLPDNWPRTGRSAPHTIFVWIAPPTKSIPYRSRSARRIETDHSQAYKTRRVPAEWPEADFIVGNPPFIEINACAEELGDGYAATLRLLTRDP